MEGLFGKFSWSLVANSSRLLFQFIGIIVLGRILSSEEYGILGIMAVFVSIGDMLIDSGMNGAILQKSTVSRQDYSTLFVYNIGVSLLLYVFIALLAPAIAAFYNIPELELYISVYCLTLIIHAIGFSQHTKLQKSLDFKSIAGISVIASSLSLAMAVAAALSGAGVWSLIIQSLVYSLLNTIGGVIMAKNSVRLEFSKESFREQFGFGMWLMMSSLLDTVCSNIYGNIIPKIGTIAQNGYYAQSKKISNVPYNLAVVSTSQVLFPVLSKTESKEFVVMYRHYSSTITYVSAILFVIVAVFSRTFVLMLLGDKWLDAAPYMAILSLACIFDVVQNLHRTALKAKAKTRTVFNMHVLKTLVRILLLAITSLMGLEAIILGILISSAINTCVSMAYLSRYVDYGVWSQARDFCRYMGMALLSAVVPVCLTSHYDLSVFHDLLLMLVCSLTYVALGCLFKDTSQRSLYCSMKNIMASRIKKS